MSALCLKVLIAAIILFCMGVFICAISKNILKIFLGVILMYNSSILALSVNQSRINEAMALVLCVFAPIVYFIGTFIIIKIYKKFNTLDMDKIEQAAKGER